MIIIIYYTCEYTEDIRRARFILIFKRGAFNI